MYNLIVEEEIKDKNTSNLTTSFCGFMQNVVLHNLFYLTGTIFFICAIFAMIYTTIYVKDLVEDITELSDTFIKTLTDIDDWIKKFEN